MDKIEMKRRWMKLGACMAIGAGIGVALHQLAIGVGIGVAFGAAFVLAKPKKDTKHG